MKQHTPHLTLMPHLAIEDTDGRFPRDVVAFELDVDEGWDGHGEFAQGAFDGDGSVGRLSSVEMRLSLLGRLKDVEVHFGGKGEGGRADLGGAL